MPYLESTTHDPRFWLCIVHGCKQRAIACCRSRHGWHAYCADHHFARCGMDRPYSSPAGFMAPEPAQDTPRTEPSTNGPTPPRVRPFGPVTPPPAPAGNAATFTTPARVPAFDLEF